MYKERSINYGHYLVSVRSRETEDSTDMQNGVCGLLRIWIGSSVFHKEIINCMNGFPILVIESLCFDIISFPVAPAVVLLFKCFILPLL